MTWSLLYEDLKEKPALKGRVAPCPADHSGCEVDKGKNTTTAALPGEARGTERLGDGQAVLLSMGKLEEGLESSTL